ncbi:hypothetical protein ACPPVO_08185 [Dactylosporangium sp. McL0621]|uniref:hypothetical protein n=1 Tax=Dactylosporangium sp. McL0621 TaxID=3415678 RepID=UPI003CEDF4D7
MSDDAVLADAISSVRRFLAALESLAAADTRDPAVYAAEQAAYRALSVDTARHYAQQRFMTLPAPPPAPPAPAPAPHRRPAAEAAPAPARPPRPTPPPDPLHPGLLR